MHWSFTGWKWIKDLLSTTYAPISVDKMLTDHAYLRSFRGHVLVQLVLGELIFKELNLNMEDCHNIENNLNNFQNDLPKYGQTVEDMTILHACFIEYLKNLEKRSPISKLWAQYFNMVNLVKHFVIIKQIKDWNIYLQCVQMMIPYFYARGHFPYVKASHIMYLQDMYKLELKLETEEFQNFTSEGYFTFKRTDKFWSDMTIGQTLMRLMKSSGGLTRGLGISDNVLMKWKQNMSAVNEVC